MVIQQQHKERFILGEAGENPLVCIGVNPSTAEPDKLDNTHRQLKARSEYLGVFISIAY